MGENNEVFQNNGDGKRLQPLTDEQARKRDHFALIEPVVCRQRRFGRGIALIPLDKLKGGCDGTPVSLAVTICHAHLTRVRGIQVRKIDERFIGVFADRKDAEEAATHELELLSTVKKVELVELQTPTP